MTASFDVSKKKAPSSLGSVLILGLGKSGKAVASYCVDLLGSRVDKLLIAGGEGNDASRAAAAEYQAKGATVLFDTYAFSEQFNLCIVSPGISENSEFYQAAKAASAEVISEVEFAWRESAAESVWVAITGTNGKTTTTSLAAHILQTCGKRAAAVGNIGDTCLEAVASGKVDCYVAEVSSYQLASTKDFAPDVAVLLNITPDHLKWHGSFEAYADAKRKIYANCGKGCTVVLDATNDVVRADVKMIKAVIAADKGFDYIPMGTCRGLNESMREDACGSAAAAFLDGGVLTVDFKGEKHVLCSESDLQIKGEHNASNALAAASAAIALGCDDAKIVEGLKSFAPLEHRIEPCGTVQGVQCYNDSKATNVDATLKALAAFGDKRPIVLLGGCDKGTDLGELVSGAEGHCKAVVCFGAAGDRFLKAFDGARLPVYSAGNLESALDEGLAHSQPGDILTLSPACSSFDEFSCFEERGEVFKRLVVQRATERGA